jgi:hypothetical protein
MVAPQWYPLSPDRQQLRQPRKKGQGVKSAWHSFTVCALCHWCFHWLGRGIGTRSRLNGDLRRRTAWLRPEKKLPTCAESRGQVQTHALKQELERSFVWAEREALVPKKMVVGEPMASEEVLGQLSNGPAVSQRPRVLWDGSGPRPLLV